MAGTVSSEHSSSSIIVATNYQPTPESRNTPTSQNLVLQELPDLGTENSLTERIPKIHAASAMKIALRSAGVPRVDIQAISAEERIAALARLQFAYYPSTAAALFSQKVIAQVRTSLLLRNPEHPRYAKFFFGQADVLGGGRPKPMPSFLHSLQGTGFVLAGPSGSGKSALIQRLRTIFGEAHRITLTGSGIAPAEMRLLPMLVVQWPHCGTLRGLLANFREAIIGELGSAASSDAAFSNFAGPNGTNAVKAACILLNLGLLVVDGACIHHIGRECKDIVQFIASFQQYSGIPTLISCTYPVLQVISRSGGNGANLSSAHAEYVDLVPNDKRWAVYCEFFWKRGLHHPELPMPTYLPSLMWKATRGNMRMLAQGFAGIHYALLDRPKIVEFGAPSESDLAGILDLRLRAFGETLRVMELYQVDREAPMEDIWAHGDYLPYDAFSGTPSREFERRIGQGGLKPKRVFVNS